MDIASIDLSATLCIEHSANRPVGRRPAVNSQDFPAKLFRMAGTARRALAVRPLPAPPGRRLVSPQFLTQLEAV